MPNVANPAISPGNLMPEQRDAMLKLLESQTFASSPRLREVLTHLVASLQDGTVDQLSEQSIGHDVFGKPVGYNASEDNIVRVATIRHLRARLEEYYQSEGRDEAWLLTIPKGKYVPSLIAAEKELETSGATVAPPDTSTIKTSNDLPGEHAATTTPLLQTIRLILAACFILSLGLAGGFAWKSKVGASDRPSGGIMGQFCRNGENMSVVVVDANLQAYRQIFHRQVILDDYIHRTYANDALNTSDPRIMDAQRYAIGANETNVSSAIVAAALRQDLPGRSIEIKHPHDVSVRDFQDQKTIVLLGGPYSNPWGQLFENRFNFRLLPIESAPASSRIHNANPQPNEAQDYTPHLDGNLDVNYVRIAILPNFAKSGRVILLGATSADSLEAAGIYLLSDESVTDMKRLFHVRSISALPSLEFVLETRGLNSVPDSHHIVGYRTVTAGSDQ